MATRKELEEETRNLLAYLLAYLEHQFGKGKVGMVLMLFDFGPVGNLAYASNAEREDVIMMLEEWLARAKSGLHTDPPGPRGEA